MKFIDLKNLHTVTKSKQMKELNVKPFEYTTLQCSAENFCSDKAGFMY